MSADLIAALWEGLVASSAATVMVLLLRRPWRLAFGSASVPLLWGMVPLALLAMALPAAEVSAPTRLLLVPTLDAVAAPAVAAAAAPSTDPRQILLLVWLLGGVVAGTWFLRLQLGFRHRLGVLRRRSDGLDQASSTAAGPAVLGLLRPRIVLPADFETRYSAAEQALILSHERSHLRRGDLYANAIATALRCIYWFNPLLHYAAARLRHDHELASDAEVLREHPQARRRYADTLLNVQLAVPGLPVGCLWQSSHPLKDRIMQMKQPLPSRSRHLAGTALAMLALSASAFAAWATQPGSPAASTPVAETQRATHRALLQVDIDGAKHSPELHYNLASGFAIGIDDWEAEFMPAAPVGSPSMRFRYRGKDVPVPTNVSMNDDKFEISVNSGTTPASVLTIAATIDRLPDPTVAAAVTQQPTYRALKPPKYPTSAVEAKLEGKVVLRVVVGSDGLPRDVAVEHASTPGVFDQAAITAVKGWKFNPAMQDGAAVEATVLVPICFSTDEQAECPATPNGLDGIYIKPELIPG